MFVLYYTTGEKFKVGPNKEEPFSAVAQENLE